MDLRWYVANWKMYLSSIEEEAFVSENRQDLIRLADEKNIVLCPSYLGIGLIRGKGEKNISLGAQDCSEEDKGAHTGQISAESLSDIAVDFVIVGHSERRQKYFETDEIISKKIAAAWKAELTPILCVGESKEQFDKQESFSYVTEQLTVLDLALTMMQEEKRYPCFVAYEPLFSIGTGVVAPHDHIKLMLALIDEKTPHSSMAKGLSCSITKLYGGSVNASNSGKLKKIPGVEGFLIGKSSINFAEFKKIIDT
ncbi:triose-phosphate isomerase [Candidatus Dependentiae bacterium]|nr:MAG: triose-phosphate isomerase [Candidatus Dependentiae bacterium]